MGKENDGQYLHWIDQAVKDSLGKEGIRSLPGFGKPLKNARYLPRWLELQKEIKEEIEKAIASKHPEERIDMINRKIKTYNLSCPSQFQKGLVTEQNLESQLNVWS